VIGVQDGEEDVGYRRQGAAPTGVGEPFSRRHVVALLGGAVMVGAGLGWEQVEAKKKKSPFKKIPVTAGENGGDRSFAGQLTISAFEVEGDDIVAVGVLKGLLTDGGVQTRAEQAVRLPLDKVTDAFASAGSAGVETLAGGSFDLVFLNMVVQILAAAFTLAPFDLKIPITKSKKQQTIIDEIYTARDAPSATPAELAAALTKLVRSY
jgi:hypothetical protein